MCPVMTQQSFDIVTKQLPTPLYVYQESRTGYIVDKLEVADPEKKEFSRVRYLITGKTQCSCLSWMKTKQCKHIRMLQGEFQGCGVPYSIANEQAGVFTEILSGLTEDMGGWDQPEDDGAPVESLEFRMSKKGMKGLKALAMIKVLSEGKLGILIKFNEPE